ncbi:MAG: hypothetical protein QNJ98_20015 [Planctomycetota bacterium]|nr:hypothetical protein [Planctomycetota bacterium]
MSRDPIRINYASRLQVYFGVGFFVLAGACLLGTLLGPTLVGITNPGANTAFRITTAICALIFLIPGLIFAFLDREVVVDRERGLLALGWRWLGWKRMTVYPIEADAHVELSTRTIPTGRHQQTVYPVSYVHAEGGTEVTSLSVYRLSRERAEALARALGLPLTDRTGGQTTRRAADALDRSAADPTTLAEGVRWRGLPKGARFRARFEDDALEVTIPPPGFDGAAVFGLGLLGFGGYLSWMFVTVTITKLEGVGGVLLGIVIAGMVLLFVLGGAYILAERVIQTTRVRVTPRGLARLRGSGRPKGRPEAAEAIEEVVLAEDATGVIVRTDHGDITVAHSVTRAEAEWIRDAVHLTLAGRPPRPPSTA